MKVTSSFHPVLSLSLLLLTVLLTIGFFSLAMPVYAQAPSQQDNTQVIQAFTSQEKTQDSVETQTRSLVMFVMGVPLLIFILVTGGLGIAMGVYGKPVFVAHMVFAGLSMTLALAHAVVGIVWFYPF